MHRTKKELRKIVYKLLLKNFFDGLGQGILGAKDLIEEDDCVVLILENGDKIKFTAENA